jgi:hypothetical protein
MELTVETTSEAPGPGQVVGEDGGDGVERGVLERIEGEPLVGEAEVELALARGLGALGEDGPEAVGGAGEQPQGLVEGVGERGGGSGNGQGRELAGQGDVELGELALEGVVEVGGMRLAAGERGLAAHDQAVLTEKPGDEIGQLLRLGVRARSAQTGRAQEQD